MPKRTCSVDGCEKPHDAKGFCGTHYQRWKKGQPLDAPLRLDVPLADRFWAKVDRTDGCWLWTAAKEKRRGYGVFTVAGRFTQAHRFAYELLVGPIPDGLHIDHLCKTPSCVRPDHMEPVTNVENVMRGDSPHAVNARKTECVNGHPFDEENTVLERDGRRRCRECGRKRSRDYQRRLREQRKDAA